MVPRFFFAFGVVFLLVFGRSHHLSCRFSPLVVRFCLFRSPVGGHRHRAEASRLRRHRGSRREEGREEENGGGRVVFLWRGFSPHGDFRRHRYRDDKDASTHEDRRSGTETPVVEESPVRSRKKWSALGGGECGMPTSTKCGGVIFFFPSGHVGCVSADA